MHQSSGMMKHANPMPNLMRVVVRHERMLGLSEGQKLALADWRMNNHDRIHVKVRQLHDLERTMYRASMQGKSKAEIMAMTSRAMQLRTDIIAGKIACRDYMRNVLSPDQYAKVLAMYDRMYGMN